MSQHVLFAMIQRWLQGDESAFEPIYHHYRPRLFRYCRKYLQSDSIAEEITTDALVNLWKKRLQINGPDTFENYLFTIARNLLINAWQKRVISLIELDHVDERRAAEVSDLCIYNELKQNYRRAVDELPPQKRAIFIMHREQNLTYREIAEQLDISPKTVENQIGSALKSLRARLAHFLHTCIL